MLILPELGPGKAEANLNLNCNGPVQLVLNGNVYYNDISVFIFIEL